MKKKIAVLRANALGDFIFALPALRALKETYPDDEIVYLGKKMHQALLADRPGPVDRVVVVPPYPGVGEAEHYEPDAAQVDTFFEQMREEQFDIAIQMHGGGGFSNPFLQRLGARMNIGLQAPNAPPLDINVPYIVHYYQ
jgi:ADP-heptose:LPS heptosyltransferase